MKNTRLNTLLVLLSFILGFTLSTQLLDNRRASLERSSKDLAQAAYIQGCSFGNLGNPENKKKCIKGSKSIRDEIHQIMEIQKIQIINKDDENTRSPANKEIKEADGKMDSRPVSV